MSRRQEYARALSDVMPGGVEAVGVYLTEHSGLPGPRGNLELAEAWADVGPDAMVRALAAEEDEYLRLCGVVGLGRMLADALAAARPGTSADCGSGERAVGGPADGGPAAVPTTSPAAAALIDRLRAHATDGSWRVREATAMALQRVGDAEPAALRSLVRAWAQDPHPLVRRAAVAGVCEPRLLRDPATATAALAACQTATALLARAPADARRDPDVRTLRQGLGYCWSVAVASDPSRGVPLFQALERDHPQDVDVAWIVRENRRKSRLRRVLDEPEGGRSAR
ncbi:HEAT repeat domain-containing protein [Xylanimonas ulmi]|uniref:HEAT repeat protein n=1 Tax=Xylanimonas ulmi TaxID=228973 RepID=A0A4Q7M0R6_9MICO|nr:HEAT repeat domain-containing protein [Xylanibacterium ulmi]RZS60152.1 HEAT repeat protein [Xylanibacterium ulmi]